eukprot:2503156-Karenia_brevis.AAC.1
MGDHNAVDIAQEVHLVALRKVGLAPDSVMLANGDPFPEGSILEGVVIDDHLIAQILPKREIRKNSGKDKEM